MAADERDWSQDKARFVAQDPDETVAGPGISPLASEFAELTRGLLDASTVADVLQQIVDATRRVVPGADLVSVTLRSPDGSFHTPVETGPAATGLDHVQYQAGEGPCVSCADPTGPAYAHSGDLAREPRWPRFGPAAADYGYQAVLATALLSDARPPQLSGALNIYTLHAFEESAAEISLLLAMHASLALAGTKAVELAELRQVQLRQALDSRDVIGQAKGILMHRRGISAEEAFDLLRRTSQHLNVKLVELATTLTHRHTELDSTEIP